ncbi:hypothetical protein, partial [Microcoleus sp. PH2017_02_FOX_O_A]|uniref:hypothetical protein n=1 Tax=Microcoleus sp. PH2017_02_FOX_O_A TaxID=2798813 RepID=UPI0025D96EC9
LLRGLFNGNVDLSGPIAAASPQNVRAGGSFRISQLPFLKQPFDAIFNWDGKRIEVEKAATRGLTASGFVGVELAGKGLPSISNLDLDVKLSNFNLEALPAEQLAFLRPIGLKNASEKNQPRQCRFHGAPHRNIGRPEFSWRRGSAEFSSKSSRFRSCTGGESDCEFR